MKIVVLSCDKDTDLFYPFHCCIEKYWPNHPEIIYATETVKNPYYKTICKDYPLNIWTKRIRETLREIDDNRILIIMDDIFIKNPVDTKRLDYLLNDVNWSNIACFNLQKNWDRLDIDDGRATGFKRRNHKASFEVSIMCGLWDRDKLIDILYIDSNPWDVEKRNDSRGYDIYINSEDHIIDWGYTYKKTIAGIKRGKWTRPEAEWLSKNGFNIDFNRRGYYG